MDKVKAVKAQLRLQQWAERISECQASSEYYSAAEPPVRCGESHLSGLTEPPLSIAI